MKKRSYSHVFFLAPHMIIFIIFFVVPMIYGIYVSFTRWDIFSPPVWTGLDNYRAILFDSESTFFRQFRQGFSNTSLLVALIVPFQILVPLIIAILLHVKPPISRIFQGIFYVPVLFSISSVVITWIFMLDPGFGLINRTLGVVVNWFGVPELWAAIVLMTIWWIIGINMVIYVAALHGIDTSVKESAMLDGAGFWTKVIRIYIPLIKFPLLFTFLAATTTQFNIFGQPAMLALDVGSERGYVIIMYIRNLAFGMARPLAGLASTMSVILGIFIGVFAVLQMYVLIRQESH
jgi:multiple sugar transport system permease protein